MSGKAGDSLSVVAFDDDSEAEAFVAALKRFLGYPQGSRYYPDAQVWIRPSAAGSRAEVLLNDTALEAATAAFGTVPVAGHFGA